MVFDFFDSIFCITTDASSPRARLAEAQFIELGIKAEFVQGEVTTPHYHGCIRAHWKCIELAKERGSKNVFIFEDDIFFINYNAATLGSALDSLPPSWEVFFLGGHLGQLPRGQQYKFSEHLIKIPTLECHAYALNLAAFKNLSFNHDVEPPFTNNIFGTLPKGYGQFSQIYTINPIMSVQLDPKQQRRLFVTLQTYARNKYLSKVI
tara:strand:- start:37 stop:657 length:621 start_codon:yes stop_codon:yes gene_type:complete